MLWHLSYNRGKSRKKLSQDERKALGRSALNAIRLVYLATAGDGLECPAGPCRPWLSRQATGSTLGQPKYLPSSRNRGFPTSANFESKLAVRALKWPANSGTSTCAKRKSTSPCLLVIPAFGRIAGERNNGNYLYKESESSKKER